tara:strand:- start:2926 stop:3126 length:201 start_codon:yes stop_codon:yes gene_type:complete
MDKNKKIENISNSELLLLRKEARDRFEDIRFKIVKIYDYWESIEREYNDLSEEINKRNLNKTKNGE